MSSCTMSSCTMSSCTMSSCNICCDHYNKSTRTKIVCCYCDFDVCRTCCETYILSESIPKCMRPECAKEWSRKFLREHFTNTFLTSKYKEHLENVLFDQEKALMPATQPIVEEKIRRMNVRREIDAIDKLIMELYHEKRVLERKYAFGGDMMAAASEAGGGGAQFVRQCPANGCRGFLSTQWKCGICEQWTCPDCHELKGPQRDVEHTCDPNSVETAKMLAKDSKPCPKCQSLIFKISGCDQMWCTQCHTAFSWKTGKLEKHIHNPHFYEWQRLNGGAAPRNPGDIECGRELDHALVNELYTATRMHSDLCTITTRPTIQGSRNQYEYAPQVIQLVDIVRSMIHNMRVEIVPFQTDYVERNQDLRVRYLENDLDEEEFKILIQRNDRMSKKNTEVAQVIQLAATALTDIVYRLMDHLKQVETNAFGLAPFFNEIETIRVYCNNLFRDIAFTYSTSSQYTFADRMAFVRGERERRARKKKMEDEPKEVLDNEKNVEKVVASK